MMTRCIANSMTIQTIARCDLSIKSTGIDDRDRSYASFPLVLYGILMIVCFIFGGYAPAAIAAHDNCVATLVAERRVSELFVPSPDPSGIIYEPSSGRLIISDADVNEIPGLFTGDNIFETNLSRTLVATSTTLPINFEPAGVTLDSDTGTFYFAEDNNLRVDVLVRNHTNPGTDFDLVRQFSTVAFGNEDPEGIAFAILPDGKKALFLVDGVNHEVYQLDPGVNGIFDGVPPTGDDTVTHFDTVSKGVNDPEGIVYNDNGFLYVIGVPNTVLHEFKLDGTVIRTCDISAAAGVKLAGATMAPGSRNPDKMNLYLVDRGVDNGIDPNQNDGRLIELSIPPLLNDAPVANAGPDQTILLPGTAVLDGSNTDDGLPDPPFLVTSQWTQQGGPTIAVIANPDAEDTEVTFPLAGIYVFRLTVSDSQLSDFDDVTITVLPAETKTTSISSPVSAGSDDAEEKPDGAVIIGSIDLDLVDSGVPQTVGIRFDGVTIPQNAIIVNAYIQFTVKGKNSDPASLILEGEAVDFAQTFDNRIVNDISARPRTTARVMWSPAPWTTIGDAGVDQRTSDLTSIIQEIVERPGWFNGSALAIIVSGTGKRDAYSLDANIPTEPILHVEYVDGVVNFPPVSFLDAGTLTLNSEWKQLETQQNLQNPVLIVGTPTTHGLQPGVIQIRNQSDGTNITARFREWDYLDKLHASESIAYLLVEEGVHQLSPDAVIQAGRFQIEGTNKWKNVAFARAFADTPHVFLNLQTANGGNTAALRVRNVNQNGFEVALIEQENLIGSGHVPETAAYVAIYNPVDTGAVIFRSTASIVPYSLENSLVTHVWTDAMGQTIRLEEEQSRDKEIFHAPEKVDQMLINNNLFFSQIVSFVGADPVVTRRK
ncbi:MAG TPA: hypothetical protein ENJ32_05870 [Crenotrichaceae bacterium]|nr:hypothetical protein [Crenotrichaceae bacterium]